MNRIYSALLAGLAGAAVFTPCARAHDILGNRFFPATIATEDPFAVDEFSLTGAFFIAPGSEENPKTEQASLGFEFTKEIFPHFAIGIEENYFRLHEAGGGNRYGWDNLGLSLKYELYRSDEHETVFSIGLDTDVGGTGTNGLGESTTTFTPTIYFGKGFGDLPDTLGALKPFAITGLVGQTLQTDAQEPNALVYGMAVEYSLPYLSQHVKDIGLPDFLNNAIPLCEFAFETPENRGGGVTTGTINPGILFETKQFQFGVEAIIPINEESGNHVGISVNLQIYIDDIFPKVFGHPVFGGRS